MNEPARNVPETTQPYLPKGVERGNDPVLQSIHEAATNKASGTVGVFELPCGYVDPDGNLHREVQVREMTGNEEDMLSSKTVPNNKKIGMLVQACLVRIGEITDRGRLNAVVNKLTVGDRVFLMFAVRRTTLGDEYPYRETCPECKFKGIFHLDLSQLEIKRMDDTAQRKYTRKLPSGRTVVFHPLLGEHEDEISKATNSTSALSLAMLLRIESIDDQPPTLQLVKNLSHRDREFLRTQFDEVEGGVETNLEMTCPQCGFEFERDLEVGQAGFFFPSSVQKDSKKRSSP